jgi:hypothetical protein
MARLVAQRDQARARVDELEAEQREASAAAQQASAELVVLSPAPFVVLGDVVGIRVPPLASASTASSSARAILNEYE